MKPLDERVLKKFATLDELTLGEYLRQERIRRKLNIMDLTKKIRWECSHAYIARIERGYRIPQPYLLKKIAKGLKVDFIHVANLTIKAHLDKHKLKLEQKYLPRQHKGCNDYKD